MPVICTVLALLMPIWPPTAFLGTYGSASVVAAQVVGPAARLAFLTCVQNCQLSSVAVSEFQLPLMTPLPLPFAQGAVQPLMCVSAALSSPGSDLNLSW